MKFRTERDFLYLRRLEINQGKREFECTIYIAEQSSCRLNSAR